MNHHNDCNLLQPYFRAFNDLFTPELLHQALDFSHLKFRDRVLPASAVLLVCIAAFLRGKVGLPLVLQWLGFGSSAANISDQALYQAHDRIGWRPIWWLRRHVLTWLSDPTRDPTAFYNGLRLIAMDGTTFTVADTPDNERTFGKSKNQYKKSGFPLMRMLALCELGTRALVDWIARSYRVSEQALSLRLARSVPAGSLLLADRNFHSGKLWEIAKNSGFFMLLRVQRGPKFPVNEYLPDGSYLSKVRLPCRKNQKAEWMTVRVIECLLTIGTRVSTYRFVTNLLDPVASPARELVQLYQKRWEIESAFAEFKDQLKGRNTVLRSYHPQGVMAELDALMIGYFAARRLALQAARRAKIDPLRISFRQMVEVLMLYVQRPKMSRDRLYRAAAKKQNKRRKRSYRRCKKVVRCAWPVKTAADGQILYNEVEIDILGEKSTP